MTTTKQRINISVDDKLARFLSTIAKRDNKPIATKARELIEHALEIEEDIYFSKIADARNKDKNFIEEDEFWNNALSN